jgi:hypothetical protein
MSTRRVFMGLFISVGLAITGVGSAVAGSFSHSTTGGKIAGTYVFLPNGYQHGGFNWWGTLDDTSNDGNAMKAQVRVAGWGWATFRNSVDKDKYWDQVVWSSGDSQVNDAWAKICRDRGTWYPDNCSSQRSYRR